MSVEFHVLASGSSGNASLLKVGEFGVLIDFGLGPRQLVSRFQGVGSFWKNVHAAVLTHGHGDHWKERSLAMLAEQKVPLYLHASHAETLDRESSAFLRMREEGLVRFFEFDRSFAVHPDCQVLPFAVCHDAEGTCGFRFEGTSAILGSAWSVAYAADLGCWKEELLPYLRDTDILALEFNHDVKMQMESGRSPHLIRRVLGDHGHLSNAQAASLVEQILANSTPARLRHLVQLHLSQQCNRAELARAAATAICERANVELHTSDPCGPGPILKLGTLTIEKIRRATRRKAKPSFYQPTLFADWE